MQIQIDRPDRLDDLLQFLRGAGCIALRRDHTSVEALVPGAASPLSERRELAAFLRSWEAPTA
ncbi:MAG TPA: hypothetical protein VNI55_07250 [Gaiellaceae bacterium]|nr:hypothetical protein [Gaiellaceae bacterium]